MDRYNIQIDRDEMKHRTRTYLGNQARVRGEAICLTTD
jgi:hypothetical protein